MPSNYLVPIDSLEYNPFDTESIKKYAKKLLGQSLQSAISNDTIFELKKTDKGEFGKLLERHYFRIENNNDSEPDIIESGVEIKSGRFELKPKAGKRVDQRMKISSINYLESFNEDDLIKSPLWKKIEKILLIIFIKDNKVKRVNEICDFADILVFPDEDIQQFRRDWLKIKNIVQSGLANQLSESDTLYLAASRSGQGKDKSNLIKAPGCNARARSFSLKQSYLNQLLGLIKYPKNSATQPIKLKIQESLGIENTVLNHVNRFKDKTYNEICEILDRDDLKTSSPQKLPKDKNSRLSRLIISKLTNLKSKAIPKRFEQFEKANIEIKTITLEKNNYLKESVSFPKIDWSTLINEELWEESRLYEIINKRFLFFVFKKNVTGDKNPKLIGSFFLGNAQ